MKFATKPTDNTHLTLDMLLHYLGKLQIQILRRYLADMKALLQIQQCKKLEKQSRFEGVAESSKLGTFLRHCMLLLSRQADYKSWHTV